MGVRNLKPVTPGSRFASRSDFSEITTDKPEKSLTVALRKKVVEIIQVELPLGDEVVGTKEDIELSIIKGTNLELKVKLLRLSMTLIGLHIYR